MSWRATVPCSRAQGEAIGAADDLFGGSDSPPVLVADEPHPGKPDDWLIHAYFDQQPSAADIATLTQLGKGPPQVEQLGEQDWVTMSQAGLEPIIAGRFHVHTPTYPPDSDRINFEIDAGRAFGTGQHATTAGCLEMLDRLHREGAQFTNIADIGTGTGLLAFAALALWPQAKCIATDVDPIAVDVARENALINHVKLGELDGELLLATADGMGRPTLAHRAPFDLIIANILAGPLIELAPRFIASLEQGGKIMLAGLLQSQVEQVTAAYGGQACVVYTTSGEWPVVVVSR